MKAIILAAGKGTRLGKYTKNMPKCMLRFNGKTLLQAQIGTLRTCDISNIIVVKGYMQDKIKIKGVKYYINKDYENTNMVESLFTAEEEMNDNALVCYSDILYEKSIVKKVLKSKTDIGVVVDKGYLDYWEDRLDNHKEDMESLVIDGNGSIMEIGDTECTADKAKFRYVGLLKFSKNGLEALKRVYHENKKKFFNKDIPWQRSKSFKRAYMTCMLQALIDSGYKVSPIIINRGWLEFDTEEDYEKYTKWLKKGDLNRFFRFEN